VSSRRKKTLLAAVVASAALAACLGSQSRVHEGALYRTGESAYDAYFKDVHDLQLVDAAFEDEKKASRKPLVDALELTPDPSDGIVMQLSHERILAAAASLGATKLEVTDDGAHFMTSTGTRGGADTEKLIFAIEATVASELVRAQKLKDVQPRVEAALKNGHDLEPHVKEDFTKYGAQKPIEVREEMSGSIDALTVVNHHARREARGAESFVRELARAVTTGGASGDAGSAGNASSVWPAMSARPSAVAAPSASSSSSSAASSPSAPRLPPPPPPARPSPPANNGGAPKPPPPPATDPPKPPPPPKPASTGEVFNP
jgi:hypothetical protein